MLLDGDCAIETPQRAIDLATCQIVMDRQLEQPV
jgi:hypothetical protein